MRKKSQVNNLFLSDRRGPEIDRSPLWTEPEAYPVPAELAGRFAPPMGGR